MNLVVHRLWAPLGPIVLLAAFCHTEDALAVRFGIGLGSFVTPLVADAARPPDAPYRFDFGLRPVLEVEPAPWISIGTYTPFTLLRAGEDSGAASSGAESVFAIAVSGRYRALRSSGPEELLYYGTARGGFATVEARAGPFLGLAIGAAGTWLDTGRGCFVELEVGHLSISRGSGEETRTQLNRWTASISVGIVFRLGGTRWDL